MGVKKQTPAGLLLHPLLLLVSYFSPFTLYFPWPPTPPCKFFPLLLCARACVSTDAELDAAFLSRRKALPDADGRACYRCPSSAWPARAAAACLGGHGSTPRMACLDAGTASPRSLAPMERRLDTAWPQPPDAAAPPQRAWFLDADVASPGGQPSAAQPATVSALPPPLTPCWLCSCVQGRRS